MKKLSLLFTSLLFIASQLFAAPPLTEKQKIDQLISYIAKLDKSKFVRNGTEYSAKDAAEHLSMKREKAGIRIKTAKDFISMVASKSSMSGKPYQIKFGDGKTENTEIVLMRELKRIEESDKAGKK